MTKSKWHSRGLLIGGALLTLGFLGFRFLPFIGAWLVKDEVAAQRVTIDSPAPDFTLLGSDGAPHTLKSYLGKKVVLEWTSPTCEFTAKQYMSGNMQALQTYARAQNVEWLAINSSNPKTVDYLSPAQARARVTKTGSNVSAFLIDADGAVGRTYGAKTTPSLYLIDEKGIVRYFGAVDDKPWGDGSVKGAKNYLIAALNDISAGKSVSVPETQPYGCSVHY
jgi:peroxiredoxin